MNSQEINLVQSSFAEIRPVAALTADLFYKRLFELDPSLRPLFKGDVAHQGRMLMAMIDAAVGGLSNIDTLGPVVRRLGARHVNYGVKDEHYPTVGKALLWTLEQGLGDKFTPAVRNAWATAYELLSDLMQFGAKEALAEQKAAA